MRTSQWARVDTFRYTLKSITQASSRIRTKCMHGSDSSPIKALRTRTMSSMVITNIYIYIRETVRYIVLIFCGFFRLSDYSFVRFVVTDAQRFHLFKQEYGMLNFLEIGYYQTPVHGFIFNGGQSVFGVDIVVSNPPIWEDVSYEENIPGPVIGWRIDNFSSGEHDSYYTSNSFSSGGRNW